MPSSPTLRQRLDQLACLPMTETILWEESMRLLIQRHATFSLSSSADFKSWISFIGFCSILWCSTAHA
ncbi:hypothetical protein B9L19_07805 [Geobacillus thermocatenulatus]|uniref:Uncharacterized protein n=1 Tax=Geobacillus thermocatenulatus TaxID=33938 RepID=A0AA91YVF1_9BACL|nr:hypothetical protein B9L19_07805 [Geobacillus thermocatenulatus]